LSVRRGVCLRGRDSRHKTNQYRRKCDSWDHAIPPKSLWGVRSNPRAKGGPVS
jgi:hypothetical protein